MGRADPDAYSFGRLLFSRPVKFALMLAVVYYFARRCKPQLHDLIDML